MNISFYDEIDHLLGNRASRYFGEGYLKTNYDIDSFNLSNQHNSLSFSCIGKVLLPPIWSKKGESIQTPHLSTIDVIELALESTRQLFKSTLNGNQLCSSNLKKITIIAGKSPVEDQLDNIPVVGHVSQRNEHGFILDIRIANMTLELSCTLNQNTSQPIIAATKQPVKIGNVMSLANEQRTAACGLVTPLNHNLNETWSIASCFAVSLQLGQALLYELDGISRAESNTLWMKKTSIILDSHLSPASNQPQPIFVRLDNPKRYTKDDGDWRRADIYSLFCNATIICSVTHKLPQSSSVTAIPA